MVSLNKIIYIWCRVVLVAQSRATVCDPMDCNPPGSSARGTFRARILDRFPFPTPGELPHPESKPSLFSPALLGGLFTTFILLPPF